MYCIHYKLCTHSIGPYIPYEVNIYAVTIAGAGKALSEVFFTQETGIPLL